jgi:hypothetical protein
MRPRERARSTDGNANSIGTEKKFATAKPKPWESQPYNYEVPTNDGGSLRYDPRRDYVEQNHGPHLDDSTPFNDDGDHGYSSSVFRLTPLLDASASTASDQGTLAGGTWEEWSDKIFKKAESKDYALGALTKRKEALKTQQIEKHVSLGCETCLLRSLREE